MATVTSETLPSWTVNRMATWTDDELRCHARDHSLHRGSGYWEAVATVPRPLPTDLLLRTAWATRASAEAVLLRPISTTREDRASVIGFLLVKGLWTSYWPAHAGGPWGWDGDNDPLTPQLSMLSESIFLPRWAAKETVNLILNPHHNTFVQFGAAGKLAFRMLSRGDLPLPVRAQLLLSPNSNFERSLPVEEVTLTERAVKDKFMFLVEQEYPALAGFPADMAAKAISKMSVPESWTNATVPAEVLRLLGR